MTTTVDAGPELGVFDGEDPVLGYLSAVLAALGGLASPGMGVAVDDPGRIDRIAVLEHLKGAVAAAQAREIVQFAKGQVAAQREEQGWTTASSDGGSPSRLPWPPSCPDGMAPAGSRWPETSPSSSQRPSA